MADTSDFTLYSGGLRGAETEFGINAERWNVKEVNYSFDGHLMERRKGVVELSEDELKKGDISMEIVSERMGRTYARAEKIRRVFQAIFHMVNSGYQVFAVGWILEDETVKGGTGWGVELAKLFNRPLSVFDQGKNQWFRWSRNGWKEDDPVITSSTFAGTGTRMLTDEGRRAIEALYEKSFGT